MRCKACNVILSKYDITKKLPDGSFLDLCSYCESNSYVYDGAVFDDDGNVKTFKAIPDEEIFKDYVGGVYSEIFVDFFLDLSNSNGGRRDLNDDY